MHQIEVLSERGSDQNLEANWTLTELNESEFDSEYTYTFESES